MAKQAWTEQNMPLEQALTPPSESPLSKKVYLDCTKFERLCNIGNTDEIAEYLESIDGQIQSTRDALEDELREVSAKECCNLEVGSVTCSMKTNRKTSMSFIDSLFECVEFNRRVVGILTKRLDEKNRMLPPRRDEALAKFDLVMDNTMAAVEAFQRKARISSGSNAAKYMNRSVFGIVAIMMIIMGIAQSPKLVMVFGISLVFGFLTAWGNAANDICNAVGTAAGCGALSLSQAVIFGSIFEGIGCLTMGPFVSKSITKGMIMTEEFEDEPELFAFAMMCVLVGGPPITLLATVYGFPISATHGLIGGIVAVGLVAKGPTGIGWEKLGMVCAGWVIAPLVGGLVALLMFSLIKLTVLNAKDPSRRATQMQSFFLWICISVNLLFIFIKGPKDLRIKPLPMAIVAGCGIGLGVTMLVYPIIWWRGKKNDEASGEQHRGGIKWPSIFSKINRMLGLDEDIVAAQKKSIRKFSFEEVRKFSKSSFVDESTPELDAEKKFVPLLVISAFSVATAHGGNDVGNALGPLSAVFAVYNSGTVQETPDIPMWAIFYGTAGFVLGILVMGKGPIKTVGTGITKLSPSKAFATQMGGAVAVLGSSAMGLPVSTSHCLVGAVVGMGIVQKIAGQGNLNLKVLVRIFLAWGITIPAASLATLAVFLPFNHIFRG